MHETARKMLTRNGWTYDSHGSGYGFLILTSEGYQWFSDSEAINLVIDHTGKTEAL